MMAHYKTTNTQTPREDLSLKETSPKITGRAASTTGPMTAFNLVEQMQYLYVRVVKARGLPQPCDPYVELKIGNYKGSTKHLEKNPYSEWNLVFSFNRERIQNTSVEILVKDKALAVEDGHEVIGRFAFNVSDAPTRVPPDSPLAPQWYRLMDQNKIKGELMLAFWIGTQADEVFPDAWHADTASVISGYGVSDTRSKVYISPRIWYLRVNAIEAQDLQLRDKNNRGQPVEIFVKATLGRLVLRSKVSQTKTTNVAWNQDIMFVVAEPFEEDLVVTVEENLINKEGSFTLGRCEIPLKNVEKRNTGSAAAAKWHDLWRTEVVENKEVRFASKIQMRISLDGGYHVLDEPAHSLSDLRPTAKILWKPTIGNLELGILSASGLPPMKPENRVNAYCVAKYGPKWVRTRTIVDSCDPKWNEQYTWDVYDPCTVITIAVFQNGYLHSWDKPGGPMDLPIGKVKIRLSTLVIDKIYTNSHPLVVMQPSGVKKMGEIQLAVRFSCTNKMNMLLTYGRPLLPKMHYLVPLSKDQISMLSEQAAYTLALRLSRAEPPLRKEVVDYVLDVKTHLWSLRKAKVNFDRIVKVMDGVFGVVKWFDGICKWTNPFSTVLVLIIFCVVVIYPGLILPALFFYFSKEGIWNFWKRPKKILHIDADLSHAYTALPDVLDEEFDPFPTRRTEEVLRRRYDRLRSMAGSIQTLLGDIAAQGERVQSILSWRDPRATAIFTSLCIIAGIIFWYVPFQCIPLLAGMYVLRHPWLRDQLPPYHYNFFRRMPAKTDIFL
ncbi:unnamed protein product [Prunus armeniaca]